MENAKTIFAMIGLVAIGFIGGYFTHAQMTRLHLKQVAKEATIPGFGDRLFRILGADEEQREKLTPLIQKYAERLHGIHSHLHHEREDVLDSMYHELHDELSEKQLVRLERFIHRHLNFRPHGEKKLHHREKRELK